MREVILLNKSILAIGIVFLFFLLALAPITFGHNIKISDVNEQPSILSWGKTLYVGGTGEGNYTKIQDAIDNASDGFTIIVYANSYYERIVINKSIALIGKRETKERPIIDAEEHGDVVIVTADEVAITGFTLINSKIGKAGIRFESSNNTFNNNFVVNNCIGIIINSSSNNSINNNFLHNNYGSALKLKNSNMCKITNNNFANFGSIRLLNSHFNLLLNNSMSISFGITLESSCNNYLLNNKNSYGYWDAIMLWKGSHNNTIAGNLISNNTDFAFRLQDSNNNSITSNTIIDCEETGIGLLRSSSNTVSYNHIKGATSGISLSYESNYNYIKKNIIEDVAKIAFRISSYYLYDTLNNSIIENKVYGCSICVELRFVRNNIFYRNTFEHYTTALNCKKSNTSWDDGKYGNYWEDYIGWDFNGDGIGDTPFIIEGDDNNDTYPLIFPFSQETGVKIRTPQKAYFYIRDLIICPFFTTLIIGNIEIVVNAANYNENINIIKVEFYINGRLCGIDKQAPYIWRWRWRFSSLIKHNHIISVIAYDDVGKIATDEINVWRFL